MNILHLIRHCAGDTLACMFYWSPNSNTADSDDQLVFKLDNYGLFESDVLELENIYNMQGKAPQG